MRRVIYFKNDDQKTDFLSGQVYRALLEYAFSKTDYFMLVYLRSNGKAYSKGQAEIKCALADFQVKRRTNPSWPGVPYTERSNTAYQVIFYKNSPEALEILKSAEKMSDWNAPLYPMDLAFFKGNRCWFYSVAHEKIAAIIDASKGDVLFAEENGLASHENVVRYDGTYFDQFDEEIDQI